MLRSRGRVIDALDIDEIRWPLAGVKVTPRGVDGRLQAILRAHENEMGDFVLHLDGTANDFLLMLVAGGGAIGGKEALRQCAPAGILPDRANGMITPSG
ncbi:hypothetical protein IVW58_24435 [Salmonella enterica subsp. enterica serovar Worthington]|nr:hypothetical protein [Salmonella enterica subsp. enterica serovar Worthington]